MPTDRCSQGRGLRPCLPLVALLAALAGSPASAQSTPPSGRLLAAQCAQCHGTNGRAVGGFESIAGMKANDLYKSLLEMSRRRPENIMDLQARAYTPAQLRLIAEYLATLPRARD